MPLFRFRPFSIPRPAPPYDARVAYIEGTGTQYINTNVVLDGNMIVKAAFQTSYFGEDSLTTYSNRNLFPFCASAGLSDYGIQYFYGDRLALFIRKNATTNEVPYIVQADTAWHVGVVNTASMTVALDGTELYDNTQDFYAGSNQQWMTLCPFAARGGAYKGKGRISSFKVTNATTGATIIDLIPVRKNGVGYMYDRVTGTLLGNQGAGDFVIGPDVPFDDEVEYIERDFTKAWMVNGSEVGSVGFDLSEYKPVDTAVKSFPNLRATYSFSPIGNNIAIAAGFTYLLLGQLMPAYALGKDGTVFGGNCSSLVTSSVEGVLTEFHTLEWSISEETDATLFLDGTSIGTAHATSTKPTKFWVLVTRGKSASDRNQMRVKNVSFGSTVYLIPVVKGNAVGFYNMVDGHVFLEEQACLSAGPVV